MGGAGKKGRAGRGGLGYVGSCLRRNDGVRAGLEMGALGSGEGDFGIILGDRVLLLELGGLGCR